jgi:hypothetical protein
MKETQSRRPSRVTVTSSLNEISIGQLANRMAERKRPSLLQQASVDRYFKTT